MDRQTHTMEAVEDIDIKPLLDKVRAFEHRFTDEVTVLYHQAETLEDDLKKIADEIDSRLKLETFGALQRVKKAKQNLQVFFNNRYSS